MKRIITYYLLLIGILLSCTKEKDNNVPLPEVPTKNITTNLVSDFNKQLIEQFGVNVPSIKKGFEANGLLKAEISERKKDGHLFLALLFEEFEEDKDSTKSIKFNFGLDEYIKFPKEIKNSQIIFIGNQLIIKDLDKGEAVNLLVKPNKNTLNKTPLIETIEGAYLAIQNVLSQEEKADPSCDCSCDACSPGSPCGTGSCSCSCGDSSCSVTCRDAYEATCESSGGCGSQ